MAKDVIEKLKKKWESLHEDASQFYFKGDFAAAEDVLKNCLDMAERMGDRGRMQAGMTLNTLAGVYRAQDRIDDAVETNLKSWDILRAELEETDYNLAGTAWNVAQLMGKAKRVEEAVQFMELALGLMDKSIGAEHPQKARVLMSMAECLEEGGGGAEVVEGCLARAFALAFNDKEGDLLAQSSVVYARNRHKAGRNQEAREILEKALAKLHEVYSLPTDPDTMNPAWIFNFPLVRSVMLRKGYQQEGLDPVPMAQVRYGLGRVLTKMGEHAAGLEQLARIEEQMRKAELRAAEAEEPDEGDAEEEDEEFEELRGLESAGEEGKAEAPEADKDEEHAEEEEEQKFWLDRAQYYCTYGAALCGIAKQTKDRALLDQAQEKYRLALDFLSESHDPEKVRKELETNMEELKAEAAKYE